ncbi:MAG: hypothetical protein ABR579_08250 [Actinomycetota bacterium]|nr:hypothetical protein [Actinomycetota bacterium]
MASGLTAALLAALVLAFEEGLGKFYPSRELWMRLRRTRGSETVRRMRERFEMGSHMRASWWFALALLAVVAAQIATIHWLHLRWYQVVINLLPALFVALALLRVPHALGAIAERMKTYERDSGDDPEAWGGEATIATL